MQQPSKPKEIKNLKIFDKTLNEDQQEAVRFVLGSPEISLIHGPPATGKTHTLIEVIRQLVADNKRVLVCGPSNVSVDNLMIRYLKHDYNAIRIGHPARVSPDVVNWTLDVLCSAKNTKKDPSQIRKEIQKHSGNPRSENSHSNKKGKAELLKKLGSITNKRISIKEIKKQIKKRKVIFSTLNGSGSAKMTHERFDVVIIDEAAQASEPDCWIAITKANKVILAGDHWQLPPIVKTFIEKKKKSTKRFVGLTYDNDLTYTLYDRMRAMYGNSIRKRLNIQYRMHTKIMEFSSQELYGRKLIAHESVSNHTLSQLPETEETVNTVVPLILIDTSDKSIASELRGEKLNMRSTVNNCEIAIIKKYIVKLINDGINQKQIAIITPYKAQVAKIVSELKDNWQDIEVGTVDGFQGKEKEVILLSLVRSNRKQEVGFVAERRRLNVAMTRARRQLVVVGDTATLGAKVHHNPEDSYSIDRSFLYSWIKWLKNNAEVRKSRNELLL
ncbi:P-loop containing nucleoside triphosphate hydrolase protein [Thamnidium elegans]|nr:P-loop containing nucleoside triphosphate hydrolase protein [Thamnidium elegans]